MSTSSLIIASVLAGNSAALLFLAAPFLMPVIVFGMFVFVGTGLIVSELQTVKN